MARKRTLKPTVKAAEAPKARAAKPKAAKPKAVAAPDFGEQIQNLANAIGVDATTGRAHQAPVVVEENPIVYPLPVPPDQNDPGPTFEQTKQQLADAEKRVAALEAKLAEVTAE
jgi:hypothetical protein